MSDHRADEICASCEAPFDRMIHSPGYSCKFVSSGRFHAHTGKMKRGEEKCLVCNPLEITQAMIDCAKAFMLQPVREHSDSGDPWVRALLDAAVNDVR